MTIEIRPYAAEVAKMRAQDELTRDVQRIVKKSVVVAEEERAKEETDKEIVELVQTSIKNIGEVDDPLLEKAVDQRDYTHGPDKSMLQPKSPVRMSFEVLQREQAKWSRHNFGHLKSDYNAPFKGMVEELGELSHALLKQEQGIRGTPAEHEANAKDAIGDMLVYMADFCTRRGWSMQDIIETTWWEVSQRDWVLYPKNGKTE